MKHDRFGTKTSTETGTWLHLGRLTVVQCGKLPGHIQNLVRFLPPAHSIALLLSGRKLVLGIDLCNMRVWLYRFIIFSSCHLTVGQGSGSGARGSRHWVKRTNLVDSRTSVTDVKFAPKTLGLLLATCNADGFIRIYEAPDIMNLSQWTLQHDINCRLSLSCLTWNPSLSRYYWIYW